MKKILVTGDFEIPSEIIPDIFQVSQIKNPKSNSEIINGLEDKWGYILGGPEFLSKEIIDKVPKLKQLVVMGTGTTSFVDVSYALKSNINISNIPSINAESVSEFAVAIIINALSNLFHSIDSVREGFSWYQNARIPLKNAHIGILGMGAIGQQLIHKLHILGCNNLSYWSLLRRMEIENKYSVKYKSLDQLLAQSDVLTIHITYNENTHHFIDSHKLENANPVIKILNFSNPKIICPYSLRNFILKNTDSFCFLDGYYQEWIHNKGIQNDPYNLLSLQSNRFVASSHIAAQDKKVIMDLLIKSMKILEKHN